MQQRRSAPTRGRRNRGTRPWREIIGEFGASGLTIQAYSERSGISRSSMTRYLALARQAERSGDVPQNAGATVAVAQNMAGSMRVGIVDRSVGVTSNASAFDVPELILGDGIRLRLPGVRARACPSSDDRSYRCGGAMMMLSTAV
jgi:hypothetical protein